MASEVAFASLPLVDLLATIASILLGAFGIPLPTMVALLYAGSLLGSQQGGLLLGSGLLLIGVVCVLVGDLTWFTIGRRYGARVLGWLCRLSISRDTCARNTAELFSRRGLNLLLFARFLPGLSMVTAPLAGASGVATPRFIIYDTIGATIWIATGLAIGGLLSSQIKLVLLIFARFGIDAAAVAAAVTVIYVAVKWINRKVLIHRLRMARISVAALNDEIESGSAPLVLDVRSSAQQLADPFLIPGALMLQPADLKTALANLPKNRLTVVYCACPNEVSAALMAKRLRKLGLSEIRPLAGGIDAWRAAGFPVAPMP